MSAVSEVARRGRQGRADLFRSGGGNCAGRDPDVATVGSDVRGDEDHDVLRVVSEKGLMLTESMSYDTSSKRSWWGLSR